MVRRALILWEKGTNRFDFLGGKVDKYEWVDVGSSHVPSELSCAILYAQLEQCEEITQRRLANFQLYKDILSPLVAKSFFRIPTVCEHSTNNAHIFYLIFHSEAVRKIFQTKMQERDIAIVSHYVPLHSAIAGRKYGRVGAGSESMPVTSAVFAGLVRLPVWVGLTEVELKNVGAAVHEIC